ncbi:MAG: serine hydrolase domain-containing protein [Hyphomonadaceae bacterium]
MDRRAFLSAAGACSLISASAPQLAQAQPARRFAQAMRYSAERNGASFLVVRHGIVMGESYPRGDADTRWPIGAGARPFAALLAATLVEDRLMTLDEPVALTLGDWGAHPVKASISIRMLVNGTSGIAFGRNDRRDLFDAISLEPVETPGARFIDDPAPYRLLVEIARRKLMTAGREPDPARYLTDRVLAPIGCVPIGWARWPDGAPRFDEGVVVSGRGWAQAGELLRREGVWRAQQLADDNTLREAVRGSFAESRAGFGVWIAAPGRTREDPGINTDLWRDSSPAPMDLCMAAGDGGQRLYFSPSEGVVIVRQSNTIDPRADWSDAQFLSLVWPDL